MIRRECRDCGESRVMPARLARMKVRRQRLSGTAMDVNFNPLAHRPAAIDQLARQQQRSDAELTGRLELQAQLRNCPQCGSERYLDYRA
jgi:ribosomal protein S27AE